jgi:hypothetical protein
MQPYTATPRDAFTDDQVTVLIRDAPALFVSAGVELLDQGLNVLGDLSDQLVGGVISHDSYADLHTSAGLDVEFSLDWGTSILRPYMNLSDGTTTMRFNLGAYYTSTPKTPLGTDPIVRNVTCIDILDRLNDPLGEAYTVDAGMGYLDAVEQILIARGFTEYTIDQTATASVLPSPKNWMLDDRTTWLNVVNDLLTGVGYQGIFSDWNGQLVVQSYNSPSMRAAEWSYDVGETTSMMEPERDVELDFYKVPNRWVFYRTNTTDGPQPIEGNGIYTFVNQGDGPTSIDGRGGRVISKVLGIDAVDQSALINSGQVTIDADQRVAAKLSLSTAPNPLHWHFDRVTVDDPDLGVTQQAVVASWSLPLNGDPMTHEWTLL